ncbi:helix-turn-helix transcriptional regulator [Leptospira noguchii]|nr:helix-turn-helix transcriptional regulator [Leptospira noguchii]
MLFLKVNDKFSTKICQNNNPSDRIRIILSETGFRQNQLAEAGNVKPPTLNGYLSGARPVGFDFAYALMKSLGYNPFGYYLGMVTKKFRRKSSVN